jgi:hypothetical protein
VLPNLGAALSHEGQFSEWAFGAGVLARTYLAEREGVLYELPLSYFSSVGKADWTLGHDALPRATLEEAFGRKLDAREARRCFGCMRQAQSGRAARSRFRSLPEYSARDVMTTRNGTVRLWCRARRARWKNWLRFDSEPLVRRGLRPLPKAPTTS